MFSKCKEMTPSRPVPDLGNGREQRGHSGPGCRERSMRVALTAAAKAALMDPASPGGLNRAAASRSCGLAPGFTKGSQ